MSPTQSRERGQGGDFVPFRLPLAESRGGASGGVWGNAPTVPRQIYSKKTANKGAGSEASLPVTLRFLRSAPKLLFPTPMLCRARWARPDYLTSDHSWSFPKAGVSPLRRRQKGNGNGRSPRSPLGNLRCTLPYLTFIGSRQIFGIRTSKSTHKSAFSGVSPPFIIERRSFDEEAF